MEFISLEKKSQTLIVRVQRPQALNALNKQVLVELSQAMDQIEADPSIRCVILTGEGDKAFVAGADIKEMESMDASEAKSFSELGQKCFRRLEILNTPVIAAVNGFALGGGLELAMACDFILASENARFGLPEVSLGLLPGFGGTIRLPRYVGQGRAKEMIFSGKHYKAKEACEMGLVNQVYPLEELLPACLELAEKISSNAPLAVGRAKLAVGEGVDLSIDAGMELERSQFSFLFKTEDHNIGISAFLEKQKPQFLGE